MPRHNKNFHECGGMPVWGHRKDRNARLRRPWAVAGPGQAAHRHPDRLEAAARPAGPGRASSRHAERSSRRGRRAGGQAARRPEICRGNKQQLAARTASGRAAAHGRIKQPGPPAHHAAPGTPAGPQAKPRAGPQPHPQRHEAATGFPATASSRSRSAAHNGATSDQAVMST